MVSKPANLNIFKNKKFKSSITDGDWSLQLCFGSGHWCECRKLQLAENEKKILLELVQSNLSFKFS